MKLEKLVGDRFKEKPSDCVVDSHALMVRGGYIKFVANGIFSSYMPLKRITRKIEQITSRDKTLSEKAPLADAASVIENLFKTL